MSRINLEQLRTFLTVVRMGGVGKAAQALNLTQPAVTTRIRNLEQSLSADLFDRTGTGLRLTKRGELLLRHAEQFEQLGELVARDVIDPQGTEGHLRLGVSETVAQCWLPEFISRLHEEFPKLEIEINVDISSNLRAGLLDREIDLAVLLGPISEYSVDNIELPGFDLAWYRTSGEGKPTGSFFDRPVITYARNTRPYRELKAELFQREGPGIPLFPSSSLSACFRLVEAGLGVAALPRTLGADYVEQGKIVEFDPGWSPSPLRFSVSYMGEPRSHMVAKAAQMAQDAAIRYARNK
ncbi:LysR family transcriptional regulator [Roseovarius sp. A21]|uniref:LysR family transcriptional regulator n=1 Tax=Roseovarius bejariae TaxID=2576383 RepID=A0A844CPL3_9RHOB|nr:LysR family transcriptional regulator [Roseovarius bejariae]MRU15415.1 LysR family transcriptional regulator [Roseovarius bejariae]